MRLWYDNPAQKWEEALPIGNGKLGAMVCGGTPEEVIWINEESIWSGKPVDRNNPDARKKLPLIRKMLREGRIDEAEKLSVMALSGVPQSQKAYQTAGELYLSFQNEKKLEQYVRELDLETGIVKVNYFSGGVKYSREIFASYPHEIMAMNMKTDRAGELSFRCMLGRCKNCLDDIFKVGQNTIGFHANTGDGGISFTVMLSVENFGGKAEVIGEHLVVQGASEATVYLSICTSFRDENPDRSCMEKIIEAKKIGYKRLRQAHKDDYQNLFGRISLYLEGEEEKEALTTDQRLFELSKGSEDIGLLKLYFQYGRYLLISSSRPGSLPATLQGIWNKEMAPPWESKYTININAEMNYWMAESTALPECHLPFFDLLEKVKENGKRTAETMYGCRGSVAHHNTDIYADTAPQDHYIPASYWVMGEAWMALHIWEHYCYTKDIDFLEDHFNVLEECVRFFSDFLILSPNGKLVTSPSVSPENTYIMKDGTQGCMCEGSTMDCEILRQLCRDYILSCQILGKEDELLQEAYRIRDLLPEYKIGRHGQLQEWMEDYEEKEPGHRHISHLFSVYPGSEFTWEDTPELMKAAQNALNRRITYGGGHTGWSRAWMVGLWARFQNGEKAYENLKKLLSQSTFLNLMDSHPLKDTAVFQIDGNMGAAAGIVEMLVQSHGDRIHLLPALPDALKTGEVNGLRLRGGAKLFMRWKDKRVIEACITPMSDFCCRLRYNETDQQICFRAGENFCIKEIG